MRTLVVDDFKFQNQVSIPLSQHLMKTDALKQWKAKEPQVIEKRGWFSRILRSTSTSGPPRPLKPGTRQPPMKRRRSVSDVAHGLVASLHGPQKPVDLQSMNRLSGKSVLYLPRDHTPGSLVLPTCIRATAQHLAQNNTARGIFRIPGSVRVVNALFNYYCCMENGETEVARTVRCANLPEHIQASVHDVASTFKRLLSVLSGGILGTLSIFDALVAIHSHLHGQPEFLRIKQTQVRARMIALAIGTIESQFRRELICGVLGLLSLIGRAAELAPREDENGEPIPTGDLMGYSALGIVFGPLIVGDLLDQYDMNIATPDSGLLLFPLTPKRLQKGQRNRAKSVPTGKPSHGPPAIDKIHIANDITEMLIANWRDVVRQMKSLGTHHPHIISPRCAHTGPLCPSISDIYVTRKPRGRDQERQDLGMQVNRDRSPEPEMSTIGLRRQRPRSMKSFTSSRLLGNPNGTVLSPTAEEGSLDDPSLHNGGISNNPAPRPVLANARNTNDFDRSLKAQTRHEARREEDSRGFETEGRLERRAGSREDNSVCGSPEVPMEEVPPRTSSKQCSFVESSVTSQSTQQVEGSDATHGSRAGEMYTHGLSNGKENEFPDLAYLHQRTLNNHDSPEASSHDDCTQATERRGLWASQESQITYNSQHEVVGTASPQRSRINFEAFEAMEPLPKGPIEGCMVVTAANYRRTGTLSSARSRDTQTEEHELVSLPLNRNRELQILPPGLPDPEATTSLISTPTTFYAPTNVPTLLGENREPPKVGQGNWKFSSAQSPRSEVRSRRVGVKAMAAMFEGQEEHKKPASSEPGLQSRDQISAAKGPRSSPSRSVRTSRSGSLWEESNPHKTNRSPKRPIASKEAQPTVLTREKRLTDPTLRTAADTVALRAAAIMDAEKQHQYPNNERPLLAGLVTADETYDQKQVVPGRRTMVPHQEEPLIAQHLSLTRPLPSPASGGSNSAEDTPLQDLLAPTPRLGSTTSLHTQSRHLQLQLGAKTDEIVQLRRQLEAQESSDVRTLSEQLREAKREIEMWKERAEAAERRVKAFEKLAARIKVVQETATVADQQRECPHELHDSSVGSEGTSDCDMDVCSGRQVGSDRRTVSAVSGRTEDAEIVTVLVRECSHGSQSHSETALTQDEPAHNKCSEVSLGVAGLDDASRSPGTAGEATLNATEIWMAAQGLLHLE